MINSDKKQAIFDRYKLHLSKIDIFLSVLYDLKQ